MMFVGATWYDYTYITFQLGFPWYFCILFWVLFSNISKRSHTSLTFPIFKLKCTILYQHQQSTELLQNNWCYLVSTICGDGIYKYISSYSSYSKIIILFCFDVCRSFQSLHISNVHSYFLHFAVNLQLHFSSISL